MSKVSQMFPSPYLKAADLPRAGLVVQIARVFARMGKDFKTQAPVKQWFLRVVKPDGTALKPVKLNPGMARVIAEIHGDESDNWSGCEITLIRNQQNIGGKLVWVMNVLAPEPEANEEDLIAGDETGEDISGEEAPIVDDVLGETEDIPF